MIVVDVETTGVDPEKHSIVSIGALDFSNPADQLYIECRVWGGATIDPQALAVNGFTEAQVRDAGKISEQEAIEHFVNWLRNKLNHTIAGQNPFFDLSFLLAAARRGKVQISLARRIVDLHSLTYGHFLKRGMAVPVENSRTGLDSDTIMKYVGLPAAPKPHKALNGAIWEAEAFSRILYHKPLFEQFQQFPVPFND